MIEAARAIFAVPPFPRATPFAVVQPHEPNADDASGGVTPAALIAALRKQRVGGAFWKADGHEQDRAHFSTDDPRTLIAAIEGRLVIVPENGRYASLSELEPGTPQAEATLELLVARDLLESVRYFSPFTGDPINALELVAIFGAWRALIETNLSIAAAFGFARWKRDTVEPLLWSGKPPPFRKATGQALADLDPAASIAVWKARVPPAFLRQIEAGPWQILEVEDGFIRSAGLGADCVPPLSIVVDDLGVHYDPARPNRLEEMLERATFPPAEIDRARALRDWIVREGVSKYGVGTGAAMKRLGGNRKHVLVVGQVEDDRSVQFGGGTIKSNRDLLQRVRALEPQAYLVYRPHPDVESGHRRGAIPTRTALELADAIDAKSPISALIDMVDEVHVITSLAGFEALMRGKAVTTHGTPFFAGWGLTRDLASPVIRRTSKRTIEELIAATLLRYPLYLDPVTNLPCPAEVVVLRLLTGNRRRNDALVPLRQFFGWMKRKGQRLLDMR